jgi:ketosteroid isomerase-like protein
MGKVATDEETAVAEIDRQWNEAYPNRDLEALERILADDWQCIDGAGRLIGKGELISRVRNTPAFLSEHKFDEFRIRLFGEIAVVTGRLSGTQITAQGDVFLRQRFTRVYAKRAGQWKAITTQVTLVDEG